MLNLNRDLVFFFFFSSFKWKLNLVGLLCGKYLTIVWCIKLSPRSKNVWRCLIFLKKGKERKLVMFKGRMKFNFQLKVCRLQSDQAELLYLFMFSNWDQTWMLWSDYYIALCIQIQYYTIDGTLIYVHFVWYQHCDYMYFIQFIHFFLHDHCVW